MVSDTQTITMRDVFRIIFRHKLLVVIPIVPAILIAYVVTQLKTPVYSASVKVIVVGTKEVEGPYYKGTDKSSDSALPELVKSRHVLERVVRALRLYERPVDFEKKFASPIRRAFIDIQLKKFNILNKKRNIEEDVDLAIDRLSENISITSPFQAGNIFSITVSDFDPGIAAATANSVSRSYVIYDVEQKIAELLLKYGEKHERVIQLRNYIDNFRNTLDGRPIPDIDALGPAAVKIMEQAKVEKDLDAEFAKQRMLALSVLLSIVFGLVLAVVAEYLDHTLKSPDDIETFLNTRFLGYIPKVKTKNRLRLSRDYDPTDEYNNSYEGLSGQISLLMKDKGLRSILISEIEASEDINNVVVGLGIHSASKGDRKVLIIDANLRRPSIFNIVNLSGNKGLADVLKGDAPFEDAVHEIEPNLYILPSYNTELNPTNLLSSSAMADLVRTANAKYDMIFISCANLKDFTDAAILASNSIDGIILVLDEGKTKRYVVKNAIAPLKEKETNIVGAIINNRSFVIPQWLYDRI
ncbi:MAG: hypothetical protein HY761_05010 [Candidatus Omnitrophica bacterium]|nr:hypothetical protein [Candidatus Omnitrophota bacterium]